MRKKERLKLYEKMSRLPFLEKSYPGKILLVAFGGIHVPLVGLAAYLARYSTIGRAAKLRVLATGLLATLVGTAATLYALRTLLAPVSLASEALRRYLDWRELPELPAEHQDQAGRLMADVGHVAERLEGSLRSLEELASTDALTGVYNRRAGDRRLAEDLARVGRGGATLTLAVLDLDQLKQVNDRHGHHAGDECLAHLAGVLARNIRRGDWVARWGGDEFVVCSWAGGETSQSSGEELLGRVAEELRGSPVRLGAGEEEVRLTFSAGVAHYREGEGAHDLIARADEALYRAKQEEGVSVVRAD